jgi:hypothetical protein
MTADTNTSGFDNFFTGLPREGYGDEPAQDDAPDQHPGIEEEDEADYARTDGRPD